MMWRERAEGREAAGELVHGGRNADEAVREGGGGVLRGVISWRDICLVFPSFPRLYAIIATVLTSVIVRDESCCSMSHSMVYLDTLRICGVLE